MKPKNIWLENFDSGGNSVAGGQNHLDLFWCNSILSLHNELTPFFRHFKTADNAN